MSPLRHQNLLRERIKKNKRGTQKSTMPEPNIENSTALKEMMKKKKKLKHLTSSLPFSDLIKVFNSYKSIFKS